MLIIPVCCILKTTLPQATLCFVLKQIEPTDVFKILRKVNTKKTTCVDNIPPKLVKYGAHILCNPITHLINKRISINVFPGVL